MLTIVNPATEEILQTVESDTPETIAAKYQRSRKAQPGWASTPLEERLDAIRRFRDLLIEQTEELAQILTSEMGKGISQARGELNATPGRVDYFLEHTAALLAEERVFPIDPNTTGPFAMEERISLEPLGVIANISAWNYPWFVGTNVYVPALLTGNTVLYKPSEYSTLTGLAMTRLLHEAGIPEDVFQCIVGGGEAGVALLEQPINGVFFTGSYGTGRKIAEAVAGRLIKVQLELGGKDPAYVRGDVDPVTAAQGLADGAFYNTGQSCCAVERIYVHESIHDAFVETFVKTVQGFVSGAPTEDNTYIGPLTRDPQRDILEDQIADAVEKGASLLTGGKRVDGKGYYFEPTVLTHVDHSMKVMRDESFGPVIGIMKVSGDDEAISLMNDTTYGLTAGVYTTQLEDAKPLMSQLNAGSVYWNCCDRVSPRLPWTGRGHSGMGSTLSTIGIQTFLQPKAWHLRSS
jgi:acyl-CoA reductase-like NAD-dependent aldehyde dehydrogenase